MYVEQMNLMEGDIMVIVDTGLLERAAKAFTRDIQNIDPTLGIRIAPAVDSQGHGRAVGGIIVLVRGPWNAQVGHLHQDGSSMGLMGKMNIRGETTNLLTLICGYWPIKGNNSESTQIWNKVQSWIHKKTKFKGSPLQWLQHVMCTWQTVAQTAKANNIVIMIEDFNSALKPTQGGE